MTGREIRVTRAEVAAWDGFAAALAGASAALAGLVFVAVSINIRRILSVPRLPGRAGETVILFLGALCECALVLIPHQPVMALGVELVIAGILALSVLGALALPALAVRTRQPLSWQMTQVIAAVAGLITFSCQRLNSRGRGARRRFGCADCSRQHESSLVRRRAGMPMLRP